MSVELDLAKELVKGRAKKTALKKSIKIDNGEVKELDEREAEIVKELGVHFSIPEEAELEIDED